MSDEAFAPNESNIVGFTEVLRFRMPNDGNLKAAIIGTASSGVIEFTIGEGI